MQCKASRAKKFPAARMNGARRRRATLARARAAVRTPWRDRMRRWTRRRNCAVCGLAPRLLTNLLGVGIQVEILGLGMQEPLEMLGLEMQEPLELLEMLELQLLEPQ